MSDSPYSERMERKDSIRRFLREQFRDDKKKEKKEQKEQESKESKENKENIANAANATSSTASSSTASTAAAAEVKPHTETKSKSTAYRLFRTVSILICDELVFFCLISASKSSSFCQCICCCLSAHF